MEFLSQDDLAIYQQIFEMFDKGKKGYIDADSLKNGMRALKMHPKDAEVKKMISEADKSKTGSVDFRAFVEVITDKLSKMDDEKTITKAFNTFDLADTGEITSDELRRALTTMGDKFSEKEVREVLKAGCDDEGSFDYESFVKVMLGAKPEIED